jgi:CBS-domain-containing membrane protein
MMNEPVSSIMSKDLITLSSSDALGTAKNIFLTKGIRHIPIVDENQQLLGVVSIFDLIKHEFNQSNFESTTIREIMTLGVAKLLPNDKIGTAAEIFGRGLFHAIPVVNENNKLQGIITPKDVLSFLYKKEYT